MRSFHHKIKNREYYLAISRSILDLISQNIYYFVEAKTSFKYTIQEKLNSEIHKNKSLV
jgi:hypothetical protein